MYQNDIHKKGIFGGELPKLANREMLRKGVCLKSLALITVVILFWAAGIQLPSLGIHSQ